MGILQTLSLVLNAGLMVYAHLGLSAVILSSQDPTLTDPGLLNRPALVEERDPPLLDPNPNNDTTAPVAKCDEADVEQYLFNGANSTRPVHSNYCSREYQYGDVTGCLLNTECISECFQETYGYSETCAECFVQIPVCSVMTGCTLFCAQDSFAPECVECNVPCGEEFNTCSGLPNLAPVEDEDPSIEDGDGGDIASNPAVVVEQCNSFDLDAVNTWYNVYNVTFVKSIDDAWNGEARLLAVIIVVFSGLWPYLKNVILVIIWYLPATRNTQSATLLWLSRLSKYTLVDVFAVVGILVGIQLQLNVGGTEAVTRAEPRFGIIAFFLATVWEYLQIELVKGMHERKIAPAESSNGAARLYFPRLWTPAVILLASVALYIAGAMSEVVYFQSTELQSICKRSYNLVTLGNALVNDLSLTSNSAAGMSWILYLSYVALNLAFPIGVHLMQAVFIFWWYRSKRLAKLIEYTLAIWCFACIEVMLIGIFAVEYKFPNLVNKIAGESNSAFLNIDSNLGVGFYILIVYSVVAGFLQYTLKIQHEEVSKSK